MEIMKDNGEVEEEGTLKINSCYIYLIGEKDSGGIKTGYLTAG